MVSLLLAPLRYGFAQLVAEPFPQRLEQPAAAVGQEEYPPGERQAATRQVPEQRLVDLMILRGTLPEPQGHLLAAHVHAQGHEERLATPVDRVLRERLAVEHERDELVPVQGR